MGFKQYLLSLRNIVKNYPCSMCKLKLKIKREKYIDISKYKDVVVPIEDCKHIDRLGSKVRTKP